MHKRTKKTQIAPTVKYLVWLRDGGRCVGCGRWAPGEEENYGWSCAHYIARSHGGRGDIPQNILTLCPECHERFDNSSDRENLKSVYLDYLESKYGPLKTTDLTYQKWRDS